MFGFEDFGTNGGHGAEFVLLLGALVLKGDDGKVEFDEVFDSGAGDGDLSGCPSLTLSEVSLDRMGIAVNPNDSQIEGEGRGS